MSACQQTDTQTIWEHGLLTWNKLDAIIQYLDETTPLEGWHIPDWLIKYKADIKSKLLPNDILRDYALYHDCGKPFCITHDEQGKRHFPNHSAKSKKIWLEYGGSAEIGELIGMDMDIHLLKSEGIAEFSARPQAISLLCAGLAEIHGNSDLFGGIESTSFKIKWKHINKTGNRLCEAMFKDKNA